MGRTPLMVASSHGNKEMVQVLIENKADLHKTTTLGDSALSLAQRKGYQDVVLSLVQRGCSFRKTRPPGSSFI